MKILYINGKNAKSFDKQVDDNVVFAKYFSPSCPACIAMEGEWDSMCKDIDEKYNTDLLLAQIDPHGMSSLENTHTYSDVDYVPHIVILKNGKKVDEYNGPKTKDKMIEYLMNGGYLTSKMSGGKKYKKHRRNRTRRSKKGAGASMSIPQNNDILDEQHIENTLRENTRDSDGQSNTTPNDYILDCIDNGIFNNCKSESCRKSKGFYNKCIPRNRKFNPRVSREIKSNAKNAYKRLIMLSLFKSKEIHDIIKNTYPEKLNQQLIPIKNQIKDVILERDYNDIDINDIKGFTEKLQEIMSGIIININVEAEDEEGYRIDSADAISATLQNRMLNGGKRKNKTMRKRKRIRRSNCCIGKRDGKSGCRTCCKSRRNKKRCITRCMRGY